MAADGLTRRNYERLAAAYAHFNARLFGGELPECLITFQRSRRARGYFWRDALQRRKGTRRVDEIALNPELFRSDRLVMSTLVHEMVHLWQAHFGHPGRRGYHNREWAAKMRTVGLQSSDTGSPGGKETGEGMTHFVIADGPFAGAWGDLLATGFRLEWEATPHQRGERSKVKYTCPYCGLAVWGKPGLSKRVGCVRCRVALLDGPDLSGVRG